MIPIREVSLKEPCSALAAKCRLPWPWRSGLKLKKPALDCVGFLPLMRAISVSCVSSQSEDSSGRQSHSEYADDAEGREIRRRTSWVRSQKIVGRDLISASLKYPY